MALREASAGAESQIPDPGMCFGCCVRRDRGGAASNASDRLLAPVNPVNESDRSSAPRPIGPVHLYALGCDIEHPRVLADVRRWSGPAHGMRAPQQIRALLRSDAAPTFRTCCAFA